MNKFLIFSLLSLSSLFSYATFNHDKDFNPSTLFNHQDSSEIKSNTINSFNLENEGEFLSIFIPEYKCVIPLTAELLSLHDIKQEWIELDIADSNLSSNSNLQNEINTEKTESFKVCADEVNDQVLSTLILPERPVLLAFGPIGVSIVATFSTIGYYSYCKFTEDMLEPPLRSGFEKVASVLISVICLPITAIEKTGEWIMFDE